MPTACMDETNREPVNAAGPTDSDMDEALVTAAKSGDQLAFEMLVKRHEPRVFALARRYTRVWEDAEDVVQQTFQKAFVNLHKFQGKSSFSTWLTRIAINEALMLLRRTRTLKELSIEDSSSDDASIHWDLADAKADPETSCLQREVGELLSVAIEQLRPGMRSALELCELRELTARETAQCLGLSMATVKARVFQGRRRLREVLSRRMRSHARAGLHSATDFAQTSLCNVWN